jgi:hypothetical protein
VANVLEQTQAQIQRRLRELAPLVTEFERLQQAEAALSGIGPSSNGRRTSKARRKPGRPRGSRSGPKPTAVKASPSGARRQGRPKGTGGRAAESLKLVEGQPGITIPELASAMGIKQNYLYRVLPGLEKEGKIRKRGRGWHPAGKR